MNSTKVKQHQLQTYIASYLSKGFKMDRVFRDILSRLVSDLTITRNQFETLIPFLKREQQFWGMTEEKILEYFRPLIRSKKTELYPTKEQPSVTLEPFYT